MTHVRLDEIIGSIERAHPHQPADQLVASVIDAAHLADVADHLIGHFVDAARRDGLSWAEIGECLGVTKQAAQKRFVIKDDLTLLTAFTAKARQTVLHAAHHAAVGQYLAVEPAHLLLGLVDVPDCLAAHELLSDKDESRVRRVADELLGSAHRGHIATSTPPMSDEAVNVLKSATNLALALQHDWIGTEHILLALLDSTTPGRFARRL